jgi:uncharacterized membrane protein YeaQ/YmgE (transglycosylase-associated protein family)
MIAIIGWMIFGLIAGLIAEAIMPGRDPGGFIITMLLGIAVVGAIPLLAAYRLIKGRTTRV